MLIGLLADTHDNLPKIKKAVEVFNQQKAELVIHAGDYIAPFSLVPLETLECGYEGVFGNNDGEKEGLARKSKGKIKDSPRQLELGGRKILAVHDLTTLDEREKESYHLIVYGHDHNPKVSREGQTLMVNPGECGGWLTNKSTICIVELETMKPQFIEI